MTIVVDDVYSGACVSKKQNKGNRKKQWPGGVRGGGVEEEQRYKRRHQKLLVFIFIFYKIPLLFCFFQLM